MDFRSAALAHDGSGVRSNDVYAMLAESALYADLYAAPLIEHRRVRLYLSADRHTPARIDYPPGSLPMLGSPVARSDGTLDPQHPLFLWDGLCWTLINPTRPPPLCYRKKGNRSVSFFPFSHALDAGEVRPLGRTEEQPLSDPEVLHRSALARPADCPRPMNGTRRSSHLQGSKEAIAKLHLAFAPLGSTISRG